MRVLITGAAGHLGAAMVEGRISAGVVIGNGTDVGGGYASGSTNTGDRARGIAGGQTVPSPAERRGDVF